MNSIDGIFCSVTFEPELRQKAQEALSYFDSKYGEIIEVLNPSYEFHKKIDITFAEDILVAVFYKGDINVNPQVLIPQNWGVLVHEGAHGVQNYPGEIGVHHQTWWLMEGIADYVRIKVAQDIEPEYGDPKDGYSKGACFLLWLEKIIKEKAVRELNEEMHYNCQKHDIETIFKNSVGKTCSELLETFKIFNKESRLKV